MHVLVVNGGPPPTVTGPGDADLVIAVDSGADHALALGLSPAVVVGDLDSISAEALARVTAAGAEIQRHQPDKDETDLELALELARRRGATEVTVLAGAHTDRLDHLVGAIGVLGSTRWLPARVRARIGRAEILLVHPGKPVSFHGVPREWVSLLALHGTARGVCTEGLRFALADGVIEPGTGFGVSNEVMGDPVTVSIGDGVLTVVRPDPKEATCER